jgi:hypothetical protein
VSDSSWNRPADATGADPHHAHLEGMEHSAEDEIESFAGGEILSRHGKVNRWLMVVYLALGVWALYYLFTYWGGLGPGLAY